MWNHLAKPELGFMNTVSEAFAGAQLRDPDLFPDFRSSRSLIVASDYGGMHKASRFESYSYLVTNTQSLSTWDESRLIVRHRYHLMKRRFEFKKLGDRRKLVALLPFLCAASDLFGICVTILVSKRVESLFRAEGRMDLTSPELAGYAEYGTLGFERMLRAVHFFGFLLRGLSSPGQDVLWVTDQEDFAVSRERIIRLNEIAANVTSHYLPHDMGKLRCGTTQSDDGSLCIEDLAAIPDLVAGATSELLSAYESDGIALRKLLITPAPARLSRKARAIMMWSADPWPRLGHLAYTIRLGDSGTLAGQQVLLHAVAPPNMPWPTS
jgi:hypothetical protein